MAVLIAASTDLSFNAKITCDVLVDNGGDLKIQDFSVLEGGTTGEPVVHIGAGGSLNLDGTTDDENSVFFTVDDGLLTIENQSIEVDIGEMDSPEGAVAALTLAPQITGRVVQFTDNSKIDGSQGNIITWAWDFGDSGTSADPSPQHTYTAGGTYNVSLTVTTSGGATSTLAFQVVVS